jgi:hypothetical protein
MLEGSDEETDLLVGENDDCEVDVEVRMRVTGFFADFEVNEEVRLLRQN